MTLPQKYRTCGIPAESVRVRLDDLAHRESVAPLGRDDCLTLIGSGELPISVAEPPDLRLHLIRGVEPSAFDQAVRQSQRHRRIIRLLAGLQLERHTADHIVDRSERAWRGEFQGCPQRVSDCKAQQTPAIPLNARHDGPLATSDVRTAYFTQAASAVRRMNRCEVPCVL